MRFCRRDAALFINTILVFFFSGFFEPGADAADGIASIIRRTQNAITIDGNSTESDWEAAETISSFVFPWFFEGEREETSVKLLWDEVNLYVCFRCEDKHISARHYERNSSVSRDDCVEIFVAPNPENPLWYANYEINCIATWLVGFNKDTLRYRWEPEGFSIGRNHKGTINNEEDEDSFWILELAIQFHNFREFDARIPPRHGDIWRINLNRCGGDINPQYSQWTASKTPRPNFHRPEDFNAVMFSSERAGRRAN